MVVGNDTPEEATATDPSAPVPNDVRCARRMGGADETVGDGQVTAETRARLAVAGVLVAVGIAYFGASADARFYLLLAIPALLLLGAVLGGPLASVLAALTETVLERFNHESELQQSLEPIRRERETIESDTSDTAQADVTSLRLSINRIQEYYTVNLAQAKGSFRLSAFALISGLVVILLGVGLLYLDAGDIQVAAIATSAGVIAEFIGGAYFYVYKRSLAQSNYYYKNLLRLQETALSVSLCERLDPARRDDAWLRMIEILMNREVLATPDIPTAPNK